MIIISHFLCSPNCLKASGIQSGLRKVTVALLYFHSEPCQPAEIGTAIVNVIAVTGFTKYPIASKAKLLHQTVHRLNLGSASCTSPAAAYLQRK